MKVLTRAFQSKLRFRPHPLKNARKYGAHIYRHKCRLRPSFPKKILNNFPRSPWTAGKYAMQKYLRPAARQRKDCKRSRYTISLTQQNKFDRTPGNFEK